MQAFLDACRPYHAEIAAELSSTKHKRHSNVAYTILDEQSAPDGRTVYARVRALLDDDFDEIKEHETVARDLAAFVHDMGMQTRFSDLLLIPRERLAGDAGKLAVWRGALRRGKRDRDADEGEMQRLRARLGARFVVPWQKYCRTTMRWFYYGMQPGAGEAEIQKLGLALQAAAGMREGALKDPSITYHLWDREMAFGELARLTPEQTQDVFWPEGCLRQNGALKDRAQSDNKFKDEEHQVEATQVFRPCLVLMASQIVAGVKVYRDFWGLTPERVEGMTRAQQANIGGSVQARKAVIRAEFPEQAAHADRIGAKLNSHFFRKLYANASHAMFHDRVLLATGFSVAPTIWIGSVLGHDAHCISSALAYTNVLVTGAREESQQQAAERLGALAMINEFI